VSGLAEPRLAASLVVTVLNEAAALPALLESIEAQAVRPDEVIFVDAGSSDGTAELLEAWAESWPGATVLAAPGSNIAQGRNVGIRAAQGPIIAVTDAGVALAPSWLERLLDALTIDRDAAVAAGFFRADAQNVFEWAMGATVLPLDDDIEPARFLPSSRSIAFRRAAWEAVGGYPEWLDYGEDLVFDLALRAAGYRFVWTPDAVVWFRPRGTLAAFFRQYYRYARGDGKANLWRNRHVIRYTAYSFGLASMLVGRRRPVALLALIGAGALYCARPVRRLFATPPPLPPTGEPRFLRPAVACLALAHIPLIRLVGDVAKMLGYPAGVAWRLRHPALVKESRGAAPSPSSSPAREGIEPGEDELLDLSIVIVSYNTRERLRGCLTSIERSTGLGRTETFVVDNASHDGSAEMVAMEFPWVILIQSGANRGYAWANNVALRRARGRQLLLLNPDTEFGPTALAEMMASLDAHPDTAAVGPKLLLGDGSLDLAGRRSFPSPTVALYRLTGLSRSFPTSPRFGRYNLSFLDPDQEAEVDALSGAFMLVRREAVAAAGMLDERFFMYGEDLDWAYRMKERGWRIRYNPTVTVTHYKGESSRQASRKATVAFFRAMHLFYAKHYRARTIFALDWVIITAIYGRMGWSLLRDALRPPTLRRVST
jgi:N-acetylglucosaminyl-diphospho-decaprenol L-rhamnosyltransferase